MIKPIVDRLGTLIVLALLVHLSVQRLPGLIKHWKIQGQTIASELSWQDLEGQERRLRGQRHVLVFWATWCGPCTVELDRLQKSVQAGELNPELIVAVSLGEDPGLVRRTVQERGYLFGVGVDTSGRLAESFAVEVTPTVVFLDENLKVEWLTSGLSPSLTLRARSFTNSTGAERSVSPGAAGQPLPLAD